MAATMAVAQMKIERLEARVSTEQKQLFARAASLQGVSLTDFIVSAVHTAAARAVQQHEILELTARDRKFFIDAVLNPPAPNENLKKAAARYRKGISR